jgi:hypothetical protein
MIFDWQNLTALAIVGLAGGYLVRAALRAIGRRAKSACGQGCGRCPSGASGEPSQLVTLEVPGVTLRRD